MFALDLGTSKFCIARLVENSANESGFGIDSLAVPAKGTKKGMVVDFQATSQCLLALIEEAEHRWNCDISSVVVGIAGSHIRSHVAKGSIGLDPHVTIDRKALHNLEEQMHSAFATSNAAQTRDLLDCVPIFYQVDQRDPLDDPTGFSGSQLGGDFLMIDSDRGYLRDIVRLVNAAGLTVDRLVSEPLASAFVCAGEDFRELGCCVVDIGGGTSDGLVFTNGKPSLAFSVPMAGFSVTSDLAIAFNLPLREAERIKTIYGLTSGQMDRIAAEDIHGQQKNIPGFAVAEVLQARCRELTIAVAKHLVPFKGRLGGGVLLTGGGSQLSGLAEVMHKSIKIPVKTVQPKWHNPNGSNPTKAERMAPKFATALGLLVLGIEGSNRKDQDTERGRLPAPTIGLMNKLRAWLREMS